MSIAAEPRTLPILVCHGSSRERGRAQGEQFRETIAETVGRWRDVLTQRHGIDAGDYIAEFLASTSFVPAIERYTPGPLDEVRGIAEGAGQPFETMFAYNLMDEEWTYGKQRRGEAPGCTVACYAAEGAAPVIAQTMDIPPVHDGSQVAVHHKPDDGMELIVFTGAGMLNLNGANAAGVGVVVNNLDMLPSSRSGLPVMFVIRGILDCATLTEAAGFVEAVPHAIGQHYAIGSPEGVVGIEGAADTTARVSTGGPRYVHTNHPLAHDAAVADPERVYRGSTTFVRQQRAEALIAGVEDRTGIEELLSDEAAPISRVPRGGSMTFGATVIECSAPPVIRVAPGPPHQTPWIDVGF
jgi:isopenicillin-N N-acyltransferase-like protein